MAPHRNGRTWRSVLASGAAVAVATTLAVRAEQARRAAARDGRFSEAMMDAAALGIATFDRELRIERVSRRFAEIDGFPAAKHIGARLGEVGSDEATALEPLLERVRGTLGTVSDEILSISRTVGTGERHLKASSFPILDAKGAFAGAGLVVEDVTLEVVGRRRSSQLLALSQDLTRVVDGPQLATRLTRFLSDVFRGDATVAFVDDERGSLELHPVMWGHPGGGRAVQDRSSLPLDGADPMCLAARSADLVESTGADTSSVCVPVLDNIGGAPIAVLRIQWPYRRDVTDASRTLLTTTASLMALALNRIRLAERLETNRFQRALNSMFDDVAILSAVRDDGGSIVDFRVEFVNESMAEDSDTVEDTGATAVRDLYPGWRRAGLFDRFVSVVETGVAWSAERVDYDDHLPDGELTSGTWSIQVVRFDDGCLVASRDVTRMVELERAERDAAEVAHRERIAVEMLQQAALPLQIPQFEGLDIGTIYQAASPDQPIGGDWYDVFRLGDRRAALVIADVSGHGPFAAAFMVKIRNVLRAVATQIETPSEVLRAVNQIICGHYAEATTHFITCCFAVIDLDTARFEWSSAGHPPPILVSGGDAGLMEQQPGMPLAVTSTAEYHSHRLQLREGDRILLYTDGLFERRDETADEGLDRLCRVLDKADHLGAQLTVEQLGQSVIDAFDDLAALVIDLGDRHPGDDAHSTA